MCPGDRAEIRAIAEEVGRFVAARLGELIDKRAANQAGRSVIRRILRAIADPLLSQTNGRERRPECLSYPREPIYDPAR